MNDPISNLGLTESNEENDPIRRYQHELRKAIERVEYLRPIVNSCQDAIARTDAVKASVSVGRASPLSPKVEIMVFCSNLKEIVPLLRELAKEGLKTDKEETHKDHNLFDVMAAREYKLGPHCTMLATVLTTGDGPSCRMQQIGVKEVPVYEMVCDEP